MTEIRRVKIRLRGTVQGVGFRPFVWRLANELGIKGWVINGNYGVEIEAVEDDEVLSNFFSRLLLEKPSLSKIDEQEIEYLDSNTFYESFEIRESVEAGEKTVLVLPDIATCPECRDEIFDPKNRRFRYPFTNCTNCGPRYSIIESVPYDRTNTTMKFFPMCPECEAEYRNPANRRFYAQPNACPVCGPHLELWNREGSSFATHEDALFGAQNAINKGEIVALKGLGGFQLIVDATNPLSVATLRVRKGRQGQKPFAVMYPDIDLVKAHCEVGEEEEKLLLSHEAPIVLLRRKENPSELEKLPCKEIAPNSNTIGVMLPYTPLHHLLMSDLGFPIIATSGNLSDEPIIIDEHDAVQKLKTIADIFLVHNRGIVRHVDDSIVRVIAGKSVILRRARGYAPLPVELKTELTKNPCVVAFGSHLKNTGAVLVGDTVFLTQHIGDMETIASECALGRSIEDILDFRNKKPEMVVCDLHPDYGSTRMAEAFAEKHDIPLFRIQHHKAHMLSAMSENDMLGEDAFGAVWDGTGYGEDGTVWGGEFFRSIKNKIVRFGYFRDFDLIGGDVASREPKRSGVSILYKIFGKEIFDSEQFAPVVALTKTERKLFPQILESKLRVYRTSSVGRLFDAVASILDICHSSDYEGHAAILLEQVIGQTATDEYYPICFKKETDGYVFDWEPMIRAIIEDNNKNISHSIISVKFHNTMAQVVVTFAKMSGEKKVVLSGGCFQNKYLMERTLKEFEKKSDFLVFTQSKIPPNDGGIALGQIAAVMNTMTEES